MNVLVLIGGREAIPVRAIPLLTNWEVLSPDVVAGVLAGDCDFFYAFKGLTAHHVEQGQVKAIAKSFWGNFVVRELIALSDRTRHNEVTHEDGMSQWRRESSALLPAGAFVWRDEFEPRFWARHGPEGETVVQATADGEFELAPRNEDIELNFDPFLSTETANLVLEGFTPQEDSNAVREEADFLNGFDAVALGHELDAEHWASLPTVQAKHAAMLMAGISPKHYPDPDQSPPPNADLPTYRSALYTLESYGQDAVRRSLRDWVLLAQSHGLQIDPRVLVAVARAVAPSSTEMETTPSTTADGGQLQNTRDSQDASNQKECGIAQNCDSDSSALVAPEWVHKVQEMALTIIARDRAKDLYPSQENIADEIARKLRDQSYVGPNGKPLAGSYIKRHGLAGISSAIHKQRSTSIKRGK